MKYCFILWTRPEIIKLFSSIKYCEDNWLDYFVIHTNQHYSENMDKVFFEELKLKDAKYNLGINWGNHWEMTGRMMIEIEKVLLEEKPDIVFVQWDTNSVLAGWLVASKLWIPVGHIEAWLRSWDMRMPEEINRIATDHLSDFLFCPTEWQKLTLKKENISESKIYVVWNTVTDAVMIVSSEIWDTYKDILNKYEVEQGKYILFTSHRPSNVDDKNNLKSLLEWIQEISAQSGKKVLFPIHPRTQNNIQKFWLDDIIQNFIIIQPVSLTENIVLQKYAFLVATDSWWMQEESCILEKKTLILRENTERPETIDVGWAILVSCKRERIISWYKDLQDRIVNWYNPFWDGASWEQIISIVTK
jgi:UDP-N-acetylglucosamine 2-epimerase (non-hydrolysing)